MVMDGTHRSRQSLTIIPSPAAYVHPEIFGQKPELAMRMLRALGVRSDVDVSSLIGYLRTWSRAGGSPGTSAEEKSGSKPEPTLTSQVSFSVSHMEKVYRMLQHELLQQGPDADLVRTALISEKLIWYFLPCVQLILKAHVT